MKKEIVFIFNAIITSALIHIFKSTHLAIEIISTISIIIDSLFILLFFSKEKKNKKVYIYIFVSYIIKVFLLYFDIFGNNIFVLPNSGKDTVAFYRATITGGNLTNYTYILKILYWIFGDNKIIFQFFNVILSLLSQILLLKILNLLDFNSKIIDRAMFIYCFLPNTLIISSILLREAIIVCLITYSLYYFIKWYKYQSKINLLFSYFIVFIAACLHSLVVFMIFPYSFIYIFYNFKNKKMEFRFVSIIKFILIISLGALIYLLFGKLLLNKFVGITDFNSVTETMAAYSTGGSAYLTSLANNNSIIVFIISAPIKLIYFIFSPMPWSWRGFADIFAFMFSSIFYGIILYKSLLCKDKTFIFKSIFYMCLILSLVHGIGCYNAGTALRHREKLLPFIIILYSYLLQAHESKDE